MPTRIDKAVHTKAFDYPVAEHWGENQNVQPHEESNVCNKDWGVSIIGVVETLYNVFLSKVDQGVSVTGACTMCPSVRMTRV